MRTIIIQNETFRRSLKFTDLKTGAVLDLTGCTAFAQMRDKPGGTLYDSAECTIDTVNGVISALWDSTQTAGWPLGPCGFDIWLECDGEQKPVYVEDCIVGKGYTEIEEDSL